MPEPTREEWKSWAAAMRDKEPKPLVYIPAPASDNNAAVCWIGTIGTTCSDGGIVL